MRSFVFTCSTSVLALVACSSPTSEDGEESESSGDGRSDDEPSLAADPDPQAAQGDPYAISFPARAQDLEDGEMWWMTGPHSGSGCGSGGCPHDIIGVRWDAGTGQWDAYKEGTSGPEAWEYVIHGKPLYAATDGEVIACWRGYPDHPWGDENPYDCACDLDTIATSCAVDPDVIGDTWTDCSSVMRVGGNALVVRMDDGTAITYNHLLRDSIPDELCPDKPELAFPSNIVPPNGTSFPVDYLTCPPGGGGTDCDASDRPRVEKGDWIGNVGHSGNSSQPHLHVAVYEIAAAGNDNFLEGAGREMSFHEAWYQERSPGVAPGEWTPLDGDALNPLVDGPDEIVIWPDPLAPRSGDTTYGTATEIATATYFNAGVSAVRNAVGEMAVRSWRVTTAGAVEEQDTDNVGNSTMIGVARIGASRDVVTARKRTSNSDLYVTTWDVNSNTGVITKDTEISLGDVNAVAIASAPPDLGVGAFTAVKNGAGNLQVDTWSINAGTLALTREDTATASAVQTQGAQKTVAIVGIQDARLPGESGEFRGAVTAAITSGGDLQVRTFEVVTGWDVTSVDVDTAGGVSDVAITAVDSGSREYVVTAVRNGTGDLQLTVWDIDEDGNIIRGDDDWANEVERVGISSGTNDDVLVTWRTTVGDLLEVATWNVDDDGELRRGGTIGGEGTVRDADVVPAGILFGQNYTVSAIRTWADDLKLIAWPTNLESSL